MPLDEVELGDLHREVMLKQQRGQKFEEKGDLWEALKLYAGAFEAVRMMFEYGLSDFFLQGRRFQQMLDFAYDLRYRLDTVKQRLRWGDWPE